MVIWRSAEDDAYVVDVPELPGVDHGYGFTKADRDCSHVVTNRNSIPACGIARFLVFLVLVGVVHLAFGQSAAEQTLAFYDSVYAHGFVGHAGSHLTSAEIALREIYERKDAATALVALYPRCHPVGKAYVLSALWQLDTNRFRVLAKDFVKDGGKIPTLSADVKGRVGADSAVITLATNVPSGREIRLRISAPWHDGKITIQHSLSPLLTATKDLIESHALDGVPRSKRITIWGEGRYLLSERDIWDGLRQAIPLRTDKSEWIEVVITDWNPDDREDNYLKLFHLLGSNVWLNQDGTVWDSKAN